jgi:FtsP/CotA-like multicopper oxidase with cupredoxin domain
VRLFAFIMYTFVLFVRCLKYCAALLLFLASVVPARAGEPVITHDNRRPAGTVKNGTLVLNLRAASGIWHPEAQGPGVSIDAFGEGDGALMAPAPLIRVPEDTTITATIENDLATTLHVHGLCEHAPDQQANQKAACATIDVPASSTHRVQFRAGRAGTYSWWASSSDLPFQARYSRDSQLSGAFIVDPAHPPVPADRVFVVTEWTSLTHDQLRQAFAADDPFLAAIAFHPEFLTLINGRSWPNTERLTYRVGDTVNWRIVNASPEPHPLHLHGFYFDVNSLGNGSVDRPFEAAQTPHVVTQLLPPGQTMSLTWMPERAGNWMFHCHIMEHVSPDRRLRDPNASTSHAAHGAPAGKAAHEGHDGPHGAAGMAGMVLGIQVLERSSASTAASGDGPADTPLDVPVETAAESCEIDGLPGSTPRLPRQLTLSMRSQLKIDGQTPTYGFVLTDGVGPTAVSSTAVNSTGAAALPPLAVPGPTLVLRRDEPVEITLVNQLPEATAVHWHGMELDSYYDGVHGFSGIGGQTTPMIEPGRSFTVRFTPPRTGTFIYHTHVHDERQLTAGLYGALLVVDPAAPAYDPNTDHPLVIGRDGVGPAPVMVLNGSQKPTFSWRAGTRHRLRLVNITRHDIVSIALIGANGPVTWRPLTKDGAPVPPGAAAPRQAMQTIAVGETYDFEYEAPATRQSLWIEVKDTEGEWRVQGHAVLK